MNLPLIEKHPVRKRESTQEFDLLQRPGQHNSKKCQAKFLEQE
jgi:hypothetical protein